jgi:uncharacterized protein
MSLGTGTAHNYVAAIAGGVILSISVSLHLLLKGRVTGWSGIFNGLVTFDTKTLYWKSSIIAGLVIASSGAWLLYGSSVPLGNQYLFESQEQFVSGSNFWAWFIAGLLVGIGTKMANGCTSGHGLCGLPRLSRRSIVSVIIFLSFAALIANLRYHFPFWTSNVFFDNAVKARHTLWAELAIVFAGGVILFNIVKNAGDKHRIYDVIVSSVVGFIFACGLLYAGILKRSVVLGFLTFNSDWDASLLLTLGTALVLNYFIFYYAINIRQAPFMEDSQLEVPKDTNIDLSLIIGSILFGLGWGLIGISPGPALANAPIYIPHVLLIFVPIMGVGQYLGGKFKEMLSPPNEEFKPFVNSV